MTFTISDQRRFLIPSSAALAATVTLTAGTSSDLAVDDIATALFRLVVVNIGGLNVENIQQANRAIYMKMASSVNPSVYENALGIELGSWKHNLKFGEYAAGNLTAWASGWRGPLIQARQSNEGITQRESVASVAHLAGYAVSIPLSFLSGVFRTSELLPLAFLENIQIELTCEANTVALFATSAGTGSYTITNPYVYVDLVTMSES